MDHRLDHVVNQVERLYSSRNPNEIKELQHELQTIQKSDDGQLAKALMNMDSINCKFFGALTYTVIITKNDNLANYNNLLEDMLLYISPTQSPNHTLPPVIIKKLLSNLALLFFHNYSQFKDPVAALLNHLIPDPNVMDITTLDETNFIILLNFVTILVEELIKREKITEIHEIIYKHVFPYVNTVYQYLNSLDSVPCNINLEALNCLNSWIIYIAMAETQSKVRYDNLESLMNFLFKNFNIAQDGIDDDSIESINKAISTLTEILETNPRMSNPYKAVVKSLLFDENNFGIFFINNVVFNGDLNNQYEDEILNFINLLIIFILNDILHISKRLLDPVNQHTLNLFAKLSDYPGVPLIDEKISEQFLGFWDEFFNTFIDDEDTFDDLLSDSPDKEQFYAVRNQISYTVCDIYCRKAQFPSNQTSISTEFLNFRLNVGDLFSTLYSLLKNPFYDLLTRNAISLVQQISINNDIKQHILSLEAIMFLLYKINDDSTFYQSQSDLLLPHVDELLASNLLGSLTPIDESFSHYSFIISTFIRYVSSIEFYFKTANGTKYLGDIFDILFSIILKSGSNLSLIASKTILNICQECRTNLVSFLPNLKILIIEMIQNIQIDNLIRQRMTNAYVSIAQTEVGSDPNNFASSLLDILKMIDSKSSEIMQELQEPLNEVTDDYLVSLLSCTNEVGKGCIIPEEIEDLYDESQKKTIDEYWSRDDLSIKPLILSIVQKYSISYKPYVNRSTVTELCCQILKSGLSEPVNSPFKFELSIIFNYLVLKIDNCDPNSVYHIFKLFETVIITNHTLVDQQTLEEVVNKLFIKNLSGLKTDPDMIQSSIDVFTSIIEKRPSLLTGGLTTFPAILSFMIECLSAKEAPIIRSILKFWVSLISLKRGNEKEHEIIRNLLTNENLGSLLTEKLLESFLNSSRSLLDYYYPIFRNLLAKLQLYFKNWLIHSLEALPTSSYKFSDHDKKQFVHQLMLTRGQISANEVLKNFWLKANGLIEFNTQVY